MKVLHYTNERENIQLINSHFKTKRQKFMSIFCWFPQSIEIYKRGLNILGRGETMDGTREGIMNTLRRLLHQIACRFLSFMSTAQITDHVRIVKLILMLDIIYNQNQNSNWIVKLTDLLFFLFYYLKFYLWLKR